MPTPRIFRQAWLIEQELAEQVSGRMTYRADMLVTLQQRELFTVGKRISDELGKPFEGARQGERVEGTLRRRVDLASGRFALIEKSREFSLVLWRPILQRHIGKPVAGVLREDGVSWTMERAGADRLLSKTRAGFSSGLKPTSGWSHRAANLAPCRLRGYLVDHLPNMIDMPTSRLSGSGCVVYGDSIQNVTIVGQPDTAQLPALILGIDDVHADRREQPLQFPIAADAQQNTIELPPRAAKHARFVGGVGLNQRIECLVKQRGVFGSRVTACGRLRGECRHRARDVEDFAGFGLVEQSDRRRSMAAQIYDPAGGKLLHCLAHRVSTDAKAGRETCFRQGLAWNHSAFLQVAHDSTINALRRFFGVPAWDWHQCVHAEELCSLTADASSSH